MKSGAKTKGYLKNESTGGIKQFIFNPTDFSTKRGVSYGTLSAPGSSYPKFQYVNGEEREIEFELFLYGSGVESYIQFLDELLPTEDSNSRFKKPPTVLFAFGRFIHKCILLDLNVKYEDFDSSLVPIQATVKLKWVVIK